LTQRSYDHRRKWIEQRILRLANSFAVDVYAFAVMSNHYHIVVRTSPARSKRWSAEEVAERWITRSSKPDRRLLRAKIKALVADPLRIERLRARLASLSWYMRFVNEPVARLANEEDDCRGRFWEGRFKSIALLDHSALLNCMIYVDLNPSRSGETKILPAPHTSARLRLHNASKAKQSLARLDLGTDRYIDLLSWSQSGAKGERVIRHPPCPAPNLTGMSDERWFETLRSHRGGYRAYGTPAALARYVTKLGQRWIQMPLLRAANAQVIDSG